MPEAMAKPELMSKTLLIFTCCPAFKLVAQLKECEFDALLGHARLSPARDAQSTSGDFPGGCNNARFIPPTCEVAPLIHRLCLVGVIRCRI